MITELQHFFVMGGYGYYVWSAIASAVLVLGANLLIPIRQHRAVLAKLNNYVKREQDS